MSSCWFENSFFSTFFVFFAMGNVLFTLGSCVFQCFERAGFQDFGRVSRDLGITGDLASAWRDLDIDGGGVVRWGGAASSVHCLDRANLTGLVLGCIEAKFCEKICVGKLSPRSTQCTPLHSSAISIFLSKFCQQVY